MIGKTTKVVLGKTLLHFIELADIDGTAAFSTQNSYFSEN